MTSLVDRLLELWDGYDWGLLPIQDNEKDWEEVLSIKKQLEENEKIVEIAKTLDIEEIIDEMGWSVSECNSKIIAKNYKEETKKLKKLESILGECPK